MRLSKNFHLNEFIKSSTADRMAIDNSPKDDEHLVNLVVLSHKILQPIREEHGVITLNSGYRSPDLNKAVGGSSKSQHCKGEAADFESYSISNPDSGRIHCPYKRDGSIRKDVLTALKQKGKVKYEKGLVGVK